MYGHVHIIANYSATKKNQSKKKIDSFKVNDAEMMSAFQIYGVTKQILFHNSVDFIGYLRQAYRGFSKSSKCLQGFTSLFTSDVGISYK